MSKLVKYPGSYSRQVGHFRKNPEVCVRGEPSILKIQIRASGRVITLEAVMRIAQTFWSTDEADTAQQARVIRSASNRYRHKVASDYCSIDSEESAQIQCHSKDLLRSGNYSRDSVNTGSRYVSMVCQDIETGTSASDILRARSFLFSMSTVSQTFDTL